LCDFFCKFFSPVFYLWILCDFFCRFFPSILFMDFIYSCVINVVQTKNFFMKSCSHSTLQNPQQHFNTIKNVKFHKIRKYNKFRKFEFLPDYAIPKVKFHKIRKYNKFRKSEFLPDCAILNVKGHKIRKYGCGTGISAGLCNSLCFHVLCNRLNK